MVNSLKKLFLVLPLLICLNACSQTKVNFKFTFTMPYCGGAKPTPEILAQAEKPQMLTSQKIYFKNIKTNKLDSVTTNQIGEVNKLLKSGTYLLIEPWRHLKQTPDGDILSKYDENCLKSEWTKSFYTLTVTKKTTKLQTININYDCPHNFPCLLEIHKPSKMRE